MTEYQPPAGFTPGGIVVYTPPAELPFEVEPAPTEGSTNPISAGAVFEALAEKEPTIEPPLAVPEGKVLNGNKVWIDFTEWVTAALEEINPVDPEEPAPEEIDLSLYLTKTEVGPAIDTPLALTPQVATLFSAFSYSFLKTTFKLANDEDADFVVLGCPERCVITFTDTHVVINWIPTAIGQFFVFFGVNNGGFLHQVSTLKITVTAAPFIIPEGELVLASAAITAGMLINIWDDGGIPKVRPALANSLSTIAHAFATTSVAAGESLVPKLFGVNALQTGLTTGERLFLSWIVPGGVSNVGPDADSGFVMQPVARAISSTQYILDIDQELLRAEEE